MKTFLITYDLFQPGQNYSGLVAELKKFPYWAHCLQSVWVVKATFSVVEIRSRLQVHLDANDKLLVIRATRPWAGRNLDTKVADWLEKSLT